MTFETMLNATSLLILLISVNSASIKDNKHVKAVGISTTTIKNQLSAVHQKASFIIAYNRTMKFEGGYIKTHNRHGGEIYKGITRRYHSKWAGWKIIDPYKKRTDFPKVLSSDQKLELMVQELYKEYYWHKIRGEEIVNQETANHLFNYCVTRGISRGIKIFQRSLGISQTGKVDNMTLNAINSRSH